MDLKRRHLEALARLAREEVLASTSDLYSELARVGYAERLGLIATPGAKRVGSLRAGYRITDKGAERARTLNEDGMEL